jgi:hypothetical protein
VLVRRVENRSNSYMIITKKIIFLDGGNTKGLFTLEVWSAIGEQSKIVPVSRPPQFDLCALIDGEPSSLGNRIKWL